MLVLTLLSLGLLKIKMRCLVDLGTCANTNYSLQFLCHTVSPTVLPWVVKQRVFSELLYVNESTSQ